jgi:hypothetical protein
MCNPWTVTPACRKQVLTFGTAPSTSSWISSEAALAVTLERRNSNNGSLRFKKNGWVCGGERVTAMIGALVSGWHRQLPVHPQQGNELQQLPVSVGRNCPGGAVRPSLGVSAPCPLFSHQGPLPAAPSPCRCWWEPAGEELVCGTPVSFQVPVRFFHLWQAAPSGVCQD